MKSNWIQNFVCPLTQTNHFINAKSHVIKNARNCSAWWGRPNDPNHAVRLNHNFPENNFSAFGDTARFRPISAFGDTARYRSISAFGDTARYRSISAFGDTARYRSISAFGDTAIRPPYDMI